MSITGTAAQNQTLTAGGTPSPHADGASGQSPTGGSGTARISPGALGNSYTLTQADVGAAITVVASYTDGFGTEESVASEPTDPVANVNDAPTATPLGERRLDEGAAALDRRGAGLRRS